MDAERGPRWLSPGLFLLLLAALAASVRLGARPLAWSELAPGSPGFALLLEQRLPRALAAVLVGAALAVAGALMQALTRNPLAGPSLMGLNPGAALAMVGAIVWAHPSSAQLAWISFAGAAVGGALVLLVAAASPRGASPERLVLAGAVVGGLLTSLTSTLILRVQLFEVLLYWTAGGLGYLSWLQLLSALPLFAAGGLATALVAGPLTAMLTGEDRARSLGVQVGRTRAASALAVLFLAGGAVALAGPVGFVGIIVPNALRPLTGERLARLLVPAALGGACVILIADLLSRRMAGSLMDVPLGALTALLGAPAIIWIVRRRMAR